MNSFSRLPPATQKLVVALGLGFIVVAGLALSWTLHQRAAAAQRHLDESIANRAAMAELVSRFSARQASGAADLDLSAAVTRSLQGKGFQPSQIQQQNGELALRIDNAPFNDVLAWMMELGEAGVVFSNVGIAQARPEGVNLTLVLRGG